MKINKGMLWLGMEWEKAIKEHIKTSDCYFLEVYEDVSSSLLDSKFIFKCYKLMGYGNRCKEFKTIIPKKYNGLVESFKPNDKFRKVDNYGNKINEV